MMLIGRWLTIAIFSLLIFPSLNLYASCELATELEGLKCKGTYRARDLGDVQSYLESLGVETSSQEKKGEKNKKKDKRKEQAKNLLIDFDLNSSSLSIATPCEVELNHKKEINLTGELCINAKRFKAHRPEIKAGSIEIKTKESIRFSHKSRLTSTGDLSLVSARGGVTIGHNSVIRGENILLESLASNQKGRTHIRHDSLVEGESLTLKSYSRATLGKSSVFNLSESIKLQSEDALFSALWKNSILNTPRLEVISSKKIIVAAKTKINAETLVLQAPECQIHKSAVLNVTNKLGTCFGTTEEPPHAVLAASPLEGSTPLLVNFDMTASTGAFSHVNVDYGDGQTETLNTLTFSHAYTTVGDFVATAEYVTPGGLKSSAYVQVRVLPVNNPPEIFLWYSQIENGGILSTILALEEFPSGISPNDIKYFHWDLGPIGKITLPMGAQGSDEYGAIPVNYPEAGSYPVELKLELQDGTFLSTGEQQVNVWDNTFPVPLYSVSTDHGSAPLTVTFSAEDAYSSDGAPITQYRWRLPTGEVRGGEELKTITHTFTEVGVYNIRLRTYNSHGNRAQVIIPIYVGVTPPENGNAPIAYIRADQRMGSAPHFVQFDGSESFDPEMSGPLTFQWDMNTFKEDSYPTIANPTHTFDKSGVYYVTMRISDTDSNENVAGTFIYVNDEGMNSPLDFVATHHGGGDVQLQSYFLANSQAYDPQSFIWHLDLGGEKVTQVSGSELFATLPGPGSYNASLTGRLVNGPYNTVQKTLTIDENTVMPEGFITQTKDIFDLYEPVILNAEITNLDPANLIFKWFTENYYFEASGTDGMQFVHQFEGVGVKTVNLLVEDRNGFSVLMTQYPSVEIIQAQNNPPFASLEILGEPGINPAPVEVTFDASGSYDGDGFIVDYFYSFGDGETHSGVEQVVSHIYQTSGFFNASLTLTDNLGAQTTIERDIFVKENEAPVAFFDIRSTDFVTPAHIKLSAEIFSHDSDGFIAKYLWDMGNGNLIETTIPTLEYTYENPGLFAITLTVFDNLNASSQYQRLITVTDNAPPTASIVAEKQFTDDFYPNQIIVKILNVQDDGEIDSLKIENNDVVIYNGELINEFSYTPEIGNNNIDVKLIDDGGLTYSQSFSFTQAQSTIDESELRIESIVENGFLKSSLVLPDFLTHISSVSWSLNNSTLLSSPLPELSYQLPSAGQLQISANVVTSSNRIFSLNSSLSIEENQLPPIAVVEQFIENGQITNMITALGSTSRNNHPIEKYEWYVDSSLVSDEPTIEDKYPKVTLKITDSLGLTSELEYVSKFDTKTDYRAPQIHTFSNPKWTSGEIKFFKLLNHPETTDVDIVINGHVIGKPLALGDNNFMYLIPFELKTYGSQLSFSTSLGTFPTSYTIYSRPVEVSPVDYQQKINDMLDLFITSSIEFDAPAEMLVEQQLFIEELKNEISLAFTENLTGTEIEKQEVRSIVFTMLKSLLGDIGHFREKNPNLESLTTVTNAPLNMIQIFKKSFLDSLISKANAGIVLPPPPPGPFESESLQELSLESIISDYQNLQNVLEETLPREDMPELIYVNWEDANKLEIHLSPHVKTSGQVFKDLVRLGALAWSVWALQEDFSVSDEIKEEVLNEVLPDNARIGLKGIWDHVTYFLDSRANGVIYDNYGVYVQHQLVKTQIALSQRYDQTKVPCLDDNRKARLFMNFDSSKSIQDNGKETPVFTPEHDLGLALCFHDSFKITKEEMKNGNYPVQLDQLVQFYKMIISTFELVETRYDYSRWKEETLPSLSNLDTLGTREASDIDFYKVPFDEFLPEMATTRDLTYGSPGGIGSSSGVREGLPIHRVSFPHHSKVPTPFEYNFEFNIPFLQGSNNFRFQSEKYAAVKFVGCPNETGYFWVNELGATYSDRIGGFVSNESTIVNPGMAIPRGVAICGRSTIDISSNNPIQPSSTGSILIKNASIISNNINIKGNGGIHYSIIEGDNITIDSQAANYQNFDISYSEIKDNVQLFGSITVGTNSSLRNFNYQPVSLNNELYIYSSLLNTNLVSSNYCQNLTLIDTDLIDTNSQLSTCFSKTDSDVFLADSSIEGGLSVDGNLTGYELKVIENGVTSITNQFNYDLPSGMKRVTFESINLINIRGYTELLDSNFKKVTINAGDLTVPELNFNGKNLTIENSTYSGAGLFEENVQIIDSELDVRPAIDGLSNLIPSKYGKNVKILGETKVSKHLSLGAGSTIANSQINGIGRLVLGTNSKVEATTITGDTQAGNDCNIVGSYLYSRKLRIADDVDISGSTFDGNWEIIVGSGPITGSNLYGNIITSGELNSKSFSCYTSPPLIYSDGEIVQECGE